MIDHYTYSVEQQLTPPARVLSPAWSRGFVFLFSSVDDDVSRLQKGNAHKALLMFGKRSVGMGVMSKWRTFPFSGKHKHYRLLEWRNLLEAHWNFGLIVVDWLKLAIASKLQ